MLRRMGFKRKELVIATALLVGATCPAAAATSEPLIVTELPDPALDYVPLSGRERISVQRSGENVEIEDAIAGFDRALGDAMRLQRATIEAACRSVKAPHGPGTDASNWWANCRYRRR